MRLFKKTIFCVFVFTTFFYSSQAQILDHSWSGVVERADSAWLATPEAKQVAENVLLYQRNVGGWPKNVAMHKPLSDQEKKDLLEEKKSTKEVTIDNGATYTEMNFLSKIYAQVPDKKYKTAFLAGLDYILKAQYQNGGWPQFYPLKKGYYTHITYNDDAMVNVLLLLKEIANQTSFYSIKPPKETVEKAKKAFDKGIDCILKTQYRQNGVLTVWCAQHDEKTLLPAKARAYELPSLSGKESAQIVLLLMSLPNPSPEIINSIESAVAFFEKTKITGYKEVKTYDEKGKIADKNLVPDESAEPIWARFMELDDSKPFFCDRDGIKKYSYREIGSERRNGYGWYTDGPGEVLKKYIKWKKGIQKIAIKQEAKDPSYIVVAKDGSGDYTRIQDAIDATKAFPYERITIFIKNGTYNEKVKVYEWNTLLSLIGEDKEKTIITFNDYFDKINLGRNSTFHTPTVLVEANDFIARNLSFVNSAGPVGQAIALSVAADRVLIENCNIIANQDALYTTGENARQYYKNCYIEGTTDFIFGQATALFDNCHIHSKIDSYITAASTHEGAEFGYVFKNCELTAADSVTKVYLGRPWRIYAKTVFIDCEMGKHILPEGWHNWSNPEAEKNAFYAEYNSTGEGGKSNKRETWSHQLTKAEAVKYTMKNILGDSEWYISK